MTLMINKILSKLIIKNVKTGQPSYTLTMTIVGFLVINVKLLFSGIEVMDKFKMSDFSGVDYAAALSAIGGIHVFNKKVTRETQKENKDA